MIEKQIMAKATKKKEPKPRPETYEKPLAIDGTFGQVIRVALGKKEEVKNERAMKAESKAAKKGMK